MSAKRLSQKTLAAERQRLEIAEMYLGGETQAEIGQKLGHPASWVHYQLKAIRKVWATELAETFEELRAASCARIDWAQREAARAWGRSKRGPAAAGDERAPEIFAGDPRFLGEYLRCEERRAQLLGLDAPKRLHVEASDFIADPKREADREGLTLEEANEIIERALSGMAEPN